MENQKQPICDICKYEGHTSLTHSTQDYEQRHDTIQRMGYESFQDWFHEFEFRNWWQLNGRTGVPLYRIPRHYMPCHITHNNAWLYQACPCNVAVSIELLGLPVPSELPRGSNRFRS